ncbi:MAG TPA: hypothetical protein VKA10_00385, partial [Prolixibacteraceae bacterium]|nr:hypothetical protein [Prolixibacteraceae bacterium]
MKNKIKLILLLFLSLYGSLSHGQNNSEFNKVKWLAIAEELKPVLSEEIIKPVGCVELIKDESAFQNWKMKPAAEVEEVYASSFKNVKQVIFDFGDHYTGYFSMDMVPTNGTPDGPLRFKLTFAEVPGELAVPFDPYPGALSRAWLQDEVVTVMDPLKEVKLERRISGRYLKVELLASSPYFDFSISNLQLKAVTSAKEMPGPIAKSADEIIKKIDQIGLNTLKECMQTVYEDGPKRDQRLWIGDLYLESIANAESFKNFDLTQR